MTTLATLLALQLCLAPAAAGRVHLVSPAPGQSALVVSPFVKPVVAGAPAAGDVVWVAAECSSLTSSRAAELVGWARQGCLVVVEDAPRLAGGALAQALGMTLGAKSSSLSVTVSPAARDHPALIGIPFATWRLPPPESGIPAVAPDAQVLLASSDGWPVFWVRPVGTGKLVGLAAQRSGWPSPLRAVGYDGMLALLLAAASHAPASDLAEVSARSAFRAWMYLGFPAGQALHRLHMEPPPGYASCRERALRAWTLADSRPDESLALSRAVAADCAKLAEWGAAKWHQVPPETLRMVSGRRDLLLSGGGLDVVHAANFSTGPSGPPVGRPTSGSQLWPNSLADNAPGPATSCWRSMRPFLSLPAELPLSANPAFRQAGADGTPLHDPWAAAWLDPEVQRLLAESVPDVRGPALVLYAQGQPWLAASCAPTGDYSPSSSALFARLAPDALTAGSGPPKAWEPSRRWLLWQQVRAEHARARWRVLAAAVHKSAPDAIFAVDAGRLADPLYAGLAPESGSEFIDCLAPVVLPNYPPGFDPGDLVAELHSLQGLVDADGDGCADRWPGVVARLRFGDALALAPSAHELLGAVALLSGSQGLWQTWASSPQAPDLALARPEELYLRWEASFEAPLRLNDLCLGARPVTDAAIWRSWASASMARPDDPAERAAALRSGHWARLLARAGFAPRVIGDAALGKQGLKNVGVLIVPSVLCASPDELEALGAFVSDGGIVLAGPGSFAFDAVHRPVARLPAWLSRGLAGLPTDPSAKVVSMRKANETCKSSVADGSLIVTIGGLSSPGLRPSPDAAVLFRDSAREPVAWEWSFGKGRVIFFSAEPSMDGPQAWLARLLEFRNLRPTVTCSAGARGACLVTPDGRRLVFVYNAGPVGKQAAVKSVQVRVGLPGVGGVAEIKPAGLASPGAFTQGAVAASLSASEVKFATSLPADGYRAFLVSMK
jgi:hypothetical protein